MSKAKRIREAKKILHDFGIFSILFLILAFVGIPIYNGLLSVPSSATYLVNFNNLDNTKTWDAFKTNHTQLDPKSLPSQSSFSAPTNVWVKASDSSWTESAMHPKNYLSFHVSMGTTFQGPPYNYQTTTLVQPSLLILLLDQNDRIRGKLYTQQGSPDFFMTDYNQTEYTFWFQIPDDMRNQPISIIVEIFGIVQTTNPNAWQDNYLHAYTHNGYFDAVDDVYGSIPPSQSQYLQTGYVNLSFLAYDRVQMHTPASSPSVWELISYSLSLAFFVTAFWNLVIYVRSKTEDWWVKNKMYVIFGFMFLVTYIVILIIVGMIM